MTHATFSSHRLASVLCVLALCFTSGACADDHDRINPWGFTEHNGPNDAPCLDVAPGRVDFGARARHHAHPTRRGTQLQRASHAACRHRRAGALGPCQGVLLRGRGGRRRRG
ncbi:MAG: hypothetical protein AAGI01_14095, partial [Myxococcota bacterium]